jgi:hypothetical protein
MKMAHNRLKDERKTALAAHGGTRRAQCVDEISHARADAETVRAAAGVRVVSARDVLEPVSESPRDHNAPATIPAARSQTSDALVGWMIVSP